MAGTGSAQPLHHQLHSSLTLGSWNTGSAQSGATLQPSQWPLSPAQMACIKRQAKPGDDWAKPADNYFLMAGLIGTALTHGSDETTNNVLAVFGDPQLMPMSVRSIRRDYDAWVRQAQAACGLPTSYKVAGAQNTSDAAGRL